MGQMPQSIWAWSIRHKLTSLLRITHSSLDSFFSNWTMYKPAPVDCTTVVHVAALFAAAFASDPHDPASDGWCSTVISLPESSDFAVDGGLPRFVCTFPRGASHIPSCQQNHSDPEAWTAVLALVVLSREYRCLAVPEAVVARNPLPAPFFFSPHFLAIYFYRLLWRCTVWSLRRLTRWILSLLHLDELFRAFHSLLSCDIQMESCFHGVCLFLHLLGPRILLIKGFVTLTLKSVTTADLLHW